MPLYRKDHSWGEFVFDFAWARAYEQHGLPYYPKLVAAVPFTPASGPRLLLDPACDAGEVRAALLDAAREHARAVGASSLHVLFPSDPDREWLAGQGLLTRLDCQFHWQNRGFRDFDDFLGTFTAEKRKKVRRERRRVQEAGIEFLELHGGDLDEPTLEAVYALHARTFLERGNPPYFTPEFFRELAASRPEALMVKLGVLRGQPVATAVFLRGADTTSTACTSRPATTRASTTASARACSASSPAPRANTRSPAASHPKPSGRCTRSSIPRSAPRSATTWDVNGITCRPTWRPSRDTSPSGVPSPTVP